MRHHQRHEQIVGEPGGAERVGQRCDRGGLRGVLEQHRVAGQQRRHDRVDRGEVRVVPGGDHEHDTERLARCPAVEAVEVVEDLIGERFGGDVDQIARAFEHATDLARADGDGPPHQLRQFFGDLVALPIEQLHEAAADRLAVGERNSGPFGLSASSPVARFERVLLAQELVSGVQLAVDGRHDLNGL